ncbi:MAG: hypothetical protein WC890_04415 [Candidatus Margulisiibacteriota bacterium]
MKKHLIALLLLTSLITPIWARRPMITDDFGVTDYGHYSVEMSYQHAVPRSGSSPYSLGNVKLKTGLMKNTDVWIQMPYYFGGYWGMGDAIATAKYRYQRWSADEGLAVRGDMKLTSGNQSSGTGTGINDFAISFICSKRFGPFLTHWNLGYTDIGEAPGAPIANTVDYQVAAEYGLDDTKQLMAEVIGNLPQNTNSLNVQLGGNWKVAQNIYLDAGYIIGLNNYSSDIVNIGCSIYY